MELKNYFAQDDQGNILPDASCYLYQRGTENLIQNLLGSNGLALNNPFHTDDQGLAQFAAPNGVYDLRVVKADRDYRITLQCNDFTEALEAVEAAADRAENSSRKNYLLFNTYAEAKAAALAEGQPVEVFADETRGGKVSRYRVESGTLVYKNYAYLTLEERLSSSNAPADGAGSIIYTPSAQAPEKSVARRLNRVLMLSAFTRGSAAQDHTEGLLEAFSRTNCQIDTGTNSDVYYLRHDTLLALSGGNRLLIREGMRVLGRGKIFIVSNQLADGTRLEVIGDGAYIGPIQVSEINPVLKRSNYYGALSANGATNFEFDRTRVLGSNGAAVHIRNNSQYFSADRVFIRYAKSDGFHIQRGSSDFVMMMPDIQQVEDDCLAVVSHGKSEGFGPCRNGTIVGGIYGNHQNGAVGSGLAFIGAHHMQALQPIIKRTGLSAIRIAETAGLEGLYTPRHITVSAPDIDETGLTTFQGAGLSKEGIFISCGFDINIPNASINRAGTHGIAASGPNIDVRLPDAKVTNSGSRGTWVAGGTATGEFVTEMWGDDARGIGATVVGTLGLKMPNLSLDGSGSDGFYMDGTNGVIQEPSVPNLRVKRSNTKNTAGKYGIFCKDTVDGDFVDWSGGGSASATNLLAVTQFGGTHVRARIDKMRDRFTSLIIPMSTNNGLRVFWNTAPPSVATGVDGGYLIGETVLNANPSSGIAYWVCTAPGPVGTWLAVRAS